MMACLMRVFVASIATVESSAVFLDWLNPFVSFAETGVVIVKGRHNLTGFNLTATTARDHAFEFALQCSELFKPPANILELIFGNRFDD